MNDTPAWLNDFVEAALTHLTPALPPSPLGLHICQTEENLLSPTYEVTVFYGRTEVLGGAIDGQESETPFWVDLAQLSREFDSIEQFTFQSRAIEPDDELAAHVAIEGRREGHPVRLQILAAAPDRFPVARHADTVDGEFINLW